ncbi:DUF5709 domain-containing protein [Streptomyces antimicrobicus]|uniref:DUF5709 domain-containing protein n=1 Tax=Streptomyces antimicrobicus TaxID=2883108 RepID=A0ABS8B3M3_9ACTN|nr:DUF5709 domain-containing protein [Streptomyces antimicrobicus]MCB5179213.1 DUF5709 domain-containing protein [Streptomyces antimicrobicus]
MSDRETQADDVYQPQEEAEPGESQPDMENALGEPGLDETLDTGYSPPDRPLAATRYGTTAEEQHAGETLDQRLAQEEPEAPATPEEADRASEADPGDDLDDELGGGPGDAGAQQGRTGPDGSEDLTGDPGGDASTAGRERAGRMTPVDEGAPVRHISVVAKDAGIDGGAAAAEEAAVHVVEEEPERD